RAEGRVVCKENAVVAGIEEALVILDLAGCQGMSTVRDGSRVKSGTIVLSGRGPARALLATERAVLNILAHVSGVTTAAVDLVFTAKKERPGKSRSAHKRKDRGGRR